jgi:ribosomal protein S18 acetylase RimI-like enzyme
MPGEPERPAFSVRPAALGDADAIARILTDALDSKFRPAFGRHAGRVMEALVRHDLGRAALRYWVALRAGALAGVVHLALAQEPDPGFAERVAAVAGWPVALRATAVLGILSHARLAADEAYIEELAVAADARRLGIGRALLDACEQEARGHGKRRLTLWVTSDNRAGIALYQAAGFRVRRRRRWLVGRLFFGAPGALFMEKAITRSTRAAADG